ncbi:MAG: sensor histidine kinase [Pseudomonadota bacterium]
MFHATAFLACGRRVLAVALLTALMVPSGRLFAAPAPFASPDQLLEYAYSPDGPWRAFSGNSQDLELARLLESHLTVWFRMAVNGAEFDRLQVPSVKLGTVFDADETFFNGQRIGAKGRIAPRTTDRVRVPAYVRVYAIPPELIQPSNELVVKVQGSDWLWPWVGQPQFGEYVDHLAIQSRAHFLLIVLDAINVCAMVMFLVLMVVMYRTGARHYQWLVAVGSCVLLSAGSDVTLMHVYDLPTPMLQWWAWICYLLLGPLSWMGLQGVIMCRYRKRELAGIALLMIAAWVWGTTSDASTAFAATAAGQVAILGWSVATAYCLWMAGHYGQPDGKLLGVVWISGPITQLLLPQVLVVGDWIIIGPYVGQFILQIALITVFTRVYLRNQRRARSLAEQLFHAQETERDRVAKALHDDFGQRLLAMKLALRRVQDPGAADVVRVTDELLHDMRRMVHDLRPTILDRFGMLEAISKVCRDVDSGEAPRVHFSGHGLRRLDKTVEEHVFRIFQEALQNAFKHARAQVIEVSLSVTSRGLDLQISDDGIGLQGYAESDGMGLGNMRERAALIGAEFTMQGLPDGGTRVALRMTTYD